MPSTPEPPRAVLGRESELAALEQFVGPDQQLTALTLIGDPGIGKTTLWEQGIERGEEHGFNCLRVRASAAATRPPFAALAELLEGAPSHALTGLPTPQRRALDAALKGSDPGGAPPEPFAISVAFLNVIRTLGETSPVLLAIDDAPWVDAPSGDVLAFAARRLTGSVRFLLTRRAADPSPLELAFADHAVGDLRVERLDDDAIANVLAARLPVTLPQRVIRDVLTAAQGNPLFALELGRAVIDQGVPAFGEPLPLRKLRGDPFGERFERLDRPVRRVLLALSLSAGMTTTEVAAVAGSATVDQALASGLIVEDGSRLRAAHPLITEAARRHASATEQRGMHHRLSQALRDPAERARHVAWATDGVDGDLAAEVAAAAKIATGRGAVHDAAEFAMHALRLTPTNDLDYGERVLGFARCLHRAGELPRATGLLNGQLDALRPGSQRAEAHFLLGLGAPPIAEQEHLEAAIVESREDPALHSIALARKVMLMALARVERLAEAESLGNEALACAAEVPDRPDVARVVAVALTWARVLRGHPVDDLIERFSGEPAGLSLYDGAVERPAGVGTAFRGELERARQAFSRLLSQADERGEARSAVVARIQLCEVEIRSGHVAEADRLLQEVRQWLTLESEEVDTYCTRLEALIAAVRGDSDAAKRHANAVLDAIGSVTGLLNWDGLDVTRAIGLAELCGGDAERAATSLQAVWNHTANEGVDDPGAFPIAADLIEALVRAGEIDAAVGVLDRLSRLASAQRHLWGLATVRRCEAVIALHGTYADDAASSLELAADEYGRLGCKFDRARSLLWLGQVQRRYRKHAAARRSLTEAAAAFEALGCSGWASQAHSSFARVSGRRPTDHGGLTPSERRVVTLAARGLSNKQIAAELIVSVFTVERHLSRAYPKLGIQRRAQLASVLDASWPPLGPPARPAAPPRGE